MSLWFMMGWASEEFADLDMGAKRLNARMVEILRASRASPRRAYVADGEGDILELMPRAAESNHPADDLLR